MHNVSHHDSRSLLTWWCRAYCLYMCIIVQGTIYSRVRELLVPFPSHYVGYPHPVYIPCRSALLSLWLTITIILLVHQILTSEKCRFESHPIPKAASALFAVLVCLLMHTITMYIQVKVHYI